MKFAVQDKRLGEYFVIKEILLLEISSGHEPLNSSHLQVVSRVIQYCDYYTIKPKCKHRG